MPYVSTIPIKERRQKCPERVFFESNNFWLWCKICKYFRGGNLWSGSAAGVDSQEREIFRRNCKWATIPKTCNTFHTTSFAPCQTTIYSQMIYWDLWVGTNMWVPGRWLKVKYFGWHKFWERIKEANNFNFVFLWFAFDYTVLYKSILHSLSFSRQQPANAGKNFFVLRNLFNAETRREAPSIEMRPLKLTYKFKLAFT